MAVELKEVASRKDLKAFIKWLEEKELEVTEEELTEDWEFLRNRLKAEIAGAIWGKNNLYKLILNSDLQVLEALKHFTEARELISQK